MRVLWLLVLCAGCVEILDAPFAHPGAKTILIVDPEAEMARAMSADSRAVIEPGERILFFFEEDQAQLRLPPRPALLRGHAACAVDELEIGPETPAACLDGARFVACDERVERPFLVAREPYLGQPCFSWRFDEDLSETELSVDRQLGAQLAATTLISVTSTLALVGQLYQSPDGPGTFMTRFQLIETTREPSLAALRDGPDPLQGARGPGLARDSRSVFLADSLGRISRVSLDPGRPPEVLVQLADGPLADIARSPSDPDALLAVTGACSLVQRDGSEWRYLVRSAFSLQAGCPGQLEWMRDDEAIAVGVGLPMRARTDAEATKALREVVRLRGGEITREPVPWPSDRPEGVLNGVSAYRSADGAFVEVAIGYALRALAGEDETIAQLWFIRDPRREGAWELIDASEQMIPLQRLMRWGDGVLATGGYEQALSDAHWTGAREAALSLQTGRAAFSPVSYNSAIPDGGGGLLLSSSIDPLMPARKRLIWRSPR